MEVRYAVDRKYDVMQYLKNNVVVNVYRVPFQAQPKKPNQKSLKHHHSPAQVGEQYGCRINSTCRSFNDLLCTLDDSLPTAVDWQYRENCIKAESCVVVCFCVCAHFGQPKM